MENVPGWTYHKVQERSYGAVHVCVNTNGPAPYLTRMDKQVVGSRGSEQETKTNIGGSKQCAN